MTDNDILKALGICSSEHLGCEDGCPYVEVPCLGGDALLKDALALVKTKEAEIGILIRKNETLKDENFELKAEVDRLRKIAENLREARATAYSNGFEIGTAKTSKDLESKLQSILDEHTLQNGDVHFVTLYKTVEKLTKELTEQKNDFKE